MTSATGRDPHPNPHDIGPGVVDTVAAMASQPFRRATSRGMTTRQADAAAASE
jgi:hypothetical protein